MSSGFCRACQCRPCQCFMSKVKWTTNITAPKFVAPRLDGVQATQQTAFRR